METPNFESRRKHPRHTLRDSVTVIDRGSGGSLGVVVNLSQEGIMLVNSKPLHSDCLYQIRLHICDGILRGVGECYIDAGIDCLWTNPAEGKASMYWSGCQIIDISDEAFDLLQRVINAVSQ